MRSTILQFVCLVSALAWAVLLFDLWIMFSQQLPDEPPAHEFAMRYRLISTLQLFALVVPGIALSFVVLSRRLPWASIAVACVAALAFSQMYLSGLSIHLRPPRGDGSIAAAFQSWARLHESLLAWHITKIAILMSLFITWIIVYAKLRREHGSSAA